MNSWVRCVELGSHGGKIQMPILFIAEPGTEKVCCAVPPQGRAATERGTMKFGQTIRQEEASCLHGPLIELSDHFLCYKELKKIVGEVEKVPPFTPPCTRRHACTHYETPLLCAWCGVSCRHRCTCGACGGRHQKSARVYTSNTANTRTHANTHARAHTQPHTRAS